MPTRPAPGEPAPVTVAARSGDRAPPLDIARSLDLAALPGTLDEARAIGDVFGRTLRGTVTVVAGAQATKDRIRRALMGHRYLHLATHGYFAPPELHSALPPEDPRPSPASFEGMGRREVSGFYPGLLSGLAWAGANAPPTNPATGVVEVGAELMTAEEVAGLNLSACELAVLSACETGLGRTAGGEGVLGLQRAFHQAGARTVVASLWKVDDEAARALMTRFYENLWQAKLGRLEAMRRAQLDLLNGRIAAGRGVSRVIGAPQRGPGTGSRGRGPTRGSGPPGSSAARPDRSLRPRRPPSRRSRFLQPGLAVLGEVTLPILNPCGGIILPRAHRREHDWLCWPFAESGASSSQDYVGAGIRANGPVCRESLPYAGLAHGGGLGVWCEPPGGLGNLARGSTARYRVG